VYNKSSAFGEKQCGGNCGWRVVEKKFIENLGRNGERRERQKKKRGNRYGRSGVVKEESTENHGRNGERRMRQRKKRGSP